MWLHHQVGGRAEALDERDRAAVGLGQTMAEQAVAGWVKSPPHCANLMDPTYTEMGAGYAVDVSSDMGV